MSNEVQENQINPIMDNKKDISGLFRKHWPHIVATLVVAALLVLGIILLSHSYQLIKKEHVQDYTDCKLTVSPTDKCTDVLEEQDTCTCFETFNLTSDFLGTVTGYYQLDNFDQTEPSYAKSRDINQLAGQLSNNLSPDCGSYSYDNTSEGMKPIAPCGAVADSMFSDSMSLLFVDDEETRFVSLLTHGIIAEEDKKGFKNPPGKLTEAFSKFTKPKSWNKYVYQLDTINEMNNGFQNEALIAWMRTDWTLKPAWRLNHTQPGYENGLPKGKYLLRIDYRNPPNQYRGTRKIIIKSELQVFNNTCYVLGIISIVVGLLLGIVYVVFYFFGPSDLKARFIRCNTSDS